MHKIIIDNQELELIGQEDYQVDNLLFLEFTSDMGIENINTLFSNTNNLLELKIELDEAERIYKNFCIFKQLQYTAGDNSTYRVTLERSNILAEAMIQITDLQMALVDMFELVGGK